MKSILYIYAEITLLLFQPKTKNFSIEIKKKINNFSFKIKRKENMCSFISPLFKFLYMNERKTYTLDS